MLTLEEILSEIEKNTKFSRKQIYDRIRKKHEELCGLVSLEGAGHLVARELGANLLIRQKRHLKIKDVVSGMKNINLKARIIQISDIREFDRKDGKKGRVCNIILTDGTGEIRLPLWDKQVSIVEEGNIKVGDVVELKNVLAKESLYGGVELGMLKYARIEKVEEDKSIPREAKRTSDYQRLPIKDLKEGNYEIKGNIVQIFNVNPLFQTCPECKTKVEMKENVYECPDHGKVEPEANMIISGIIDDGSGSIRSVFFRDQARILTGLDPFVLSKMSQEEAIGLIKDNALGNEIIMKGRVQKNKIFDALEMIVNEVEGLNVEKESKRLINELKTLSV